jgi:hypothetical protein
MKTKLSIFILMAMVLMLFALPAPVSATKPVNDLVISAHLTIDGDASASGDFTMVSPLLGISDSGPATETFHIDWEDYTIHGVKVLNGTKGTIVLKFQAQLTPDGAVGTFTIISGTGAYLKLHGVGSTFATIIGDSIDALYQGSAHID